MKWLRAVLISLLISLLVGLAIGTWIRLQLEAPVRYIGQLAPHDHLSVEVATGAKFYFGPVPDA